MPHPAALVPLLRIAREAGSFMLLNDWTEEALVKLGTPQIVAAVAASMASDGAWFGRHAAHVLARIKRPESERALLRLLAATSDVRRCTQLGMALCRLGATLPEALDRLHALVSCEHFDPIQGSLDETLLTLCAAQGFQPREARAWRDRVSAREVADAMANEAWARQHRHDPRYADIFEPSDEEGRNEEKG